MKKIITNLALAITLAYLPISAQAAVQYYDAAKWMQAEEQPRRKAFLRELLEIHNKIGSASGIQARLLISNERDINAFATEVKEEKLIVLHMGLLATMMDDRDEVAAVLAHEYGHHAKNHIAKGKTTTGLLSVLGAVAGAVIDRKLGGGTIGQKTMGAGAEMISASFSRTQETEADLVGLPWLVQGGYSPEGAVRLQRMFLAMKGTEQFSFFQSHPNSAERVQDLIAAIAANPQAQEMLNLPLVAMTKPGHDDESDATKLAVADCPWLSVNVVTEALPQFRPWEVVAGSGPGMCTFSGEESKERSRKTGLPRITITQQFQATPPAAAKFVQGMRAGLVKDYRVEATPALGNQGFAYAEKGERNSPTTNWIAHGDKAVLMVSLIKQGSTTDDERAAVERVIVSALTGSSKPDVAEQATSCPYFDQAVLKTLLPSKTLKVQQFGGDSCMANTEDSSTVMFTRMAAANKSQGEQILSGMSNKACQQKPVPELGPMAMIEFECTSGNPSSTIRFLKGTSILMVSHIPNAKEPTKEQRDLLLTLGQAMLRNQQIK